MNIWEEFTLKDVVKINYGKALKSSDRKQGIVPVFSSGGITGFHNQAHVKEKGIIIGRKGTIGKVYISNHPFCCIDTAYYITSNPDVYDFYFLYYALGTLGLEDLNEDSAVPGLNRNTLYSQVLSLPPIKEQKAIASVLSSLDDKIDLLHRQNQTLEKMAETLFRQWFVEGAQNNWVLSCIGDLFLPAKGKNITKNNVILGEYPVVAGGLDPSCYHINYNTEKPVVTISASGANAGYVRLYHNHVWSSDSSYVDKTIFNYIYFSYVLLKYNQQNLFDMQVGSAQPHVYPKNIANVELLLPPRELIQKYEILITPMFLKIGKNNFQIRTLEKLRDALLPKLMSGEFRVYYEDNNRSIVT